MATTTYQTTVTATINGQPITIQTLAVTVPATKTAAWVKGWAEKKARIENRAHRAGALVTEAWVIPTA
ncbi:hypothetical protein [Embleya sp. NPDC005971]|uniref:hypothetical protein n=1 Tax=Embleya sp. NPDC005971 TaxID=3156724 RepID=UPI00340A4D74